MPQRAGRVPGRRQAEGEDEQDRQNADRAGMPDRPAQPTCHPALIGAATASFKQLPPVGPAEREHAQRQADDDPRAERDRDVTELPAAADLLRRGTESGRNTERMPWVIHFSGNSEAMVRIQLGDAVYWKKTPEMNCRTSATGVTIAGAPRPDRAREEKAIPHSVHALIPSSDTQAKVTHFAAVEGTGRS